MRREQKRAATKRSLSDAAIALFRAKGFAPTTVGDIAEAVGVSRPTFFRYFPTKEDVALYWLKDLTAHVRRTVAGRPQGELAIDATLRAVRGLLASAAADPAVFLPQAEVLLGEPVLRRQVRASQLDYEEALAPFIAADLGGGMHAELQARAALGALAAGAETAVSIWAKQPAQVDLVGLFAGVEELIRCGLAGETPAVVVVAAQNEQSRDRALRVAASALLSQLAARERELGPTPYAPAAAAAFSGL